MSKEDLKVYADRIDDLSKAVDKDGKLPADRRNEWVVACCEQPATRIEGALEIRVPPLWRKDLGPPPEPLRIAALTEKQLERLIVALTQSKELLWGEAVIAGAVGHIRDKRLDGYFERKLKACADSEEPHFAADLMQGLLAQREWSDGAALITRFQDREYDDAKGRIQDVREFLSKVPAAK